MLEIIAVIVLANKMGSMAVRKGQKKGAWIFYTVLAWILGELAGIIFGIVLLKADNYFALMPFGIAGAVGGYLIIRSILAKKPDIESTSFEFEQHQQRQQ